MPVLKKLRAGIFLTVSRDCYHYTQLIDLHHLFG